MPSKTSVTISAPKKTRLSFKDPDSGRIVNAKWKDLVSIYKEEQENSIKRTKLDYKTLYPNNYEKQKVSLVLNVFNETTVAALKQRNYDDTALFVEKILKLWKILNIKSPNDGVRLNDPGR